MTVMDIVTVSNTSKSTVLRVARDLFPGKMGHGHRTVFSKEEAVKLMGVLRKPGFVAPLEEDHSGAVKSAKVAQLQESNQCNRPKLPNGKQMEVLYRAAKDKLMTPVQFQEAIGVTIPRQPGQFAQLPAPEEARVPTEQLATELRSLIPAATKAVTKAEEAANSARARVIAKETGRIVQDRLNFRLPLGQR